MQGDEGEQAGVRAAPATDIQVYGGAAAAVAAVRVEADGVPHCNAQLGVEAQQRKAMLSWQMPEI